jgi:preprotein translocase subunit YajC
MIQLLQASPTPGMGGLLQFAPMIFIFVIFYFLLIAPMRKKQKKTQEMLAKLKKGDEVVTQGGVFGRIAAMDDERGFVVLEISSNVKVKVLRSAIVGLAGEPEEKTTP